MLTGYHNHTTFCDGKNTVEEMTVAAIEKGFSAIGFSGHGYTPFDESYCMKDTKGYIDEVKRIREKYKKEISVYLGVEENAGAEVNRSDFDYIIGSQHYFNICGKYFDVDASYEDLKKALAVVGGNPLALAEIYYSSFCLYILRRKPDIIGHFDLLTKFDESNPPIFTGNKEYKKLSLKYLERVLPAGSIFEVNTGAMSRGYRKSPYPDVDMLYALRKNDAKIMLSSDSHSVDTIDFGYDEIRMMLRYIGFTHLWEIHDGEHKRVEI